MWGFLKWWYTTGWAKLWASWLQRTKQVYLDFSVSSLIRTLFAPWRRITTSGGRTLKEHLRAGVDNLVSRTVGLVVRLLVLATALVLSLLTALAGLVTAVLWPFLPLAALALIIRGII